jgi:diguanylate cyclase (GGDEF)-like protein
MISQTWLDALPFGILITDADLHLKQANRWLADRLPGVAQLIGQPLAQAFPELVERSLMAAYELTLQSGRPTYLPNNLYGSFLRLPPEPGRGLESMPQSATITPLNEAGQVVGTMTLIEDVTQRLLTERQLEREIDKMTALHEVDQALATLDLQACLQIIVDRTGSLFAAESTELFLVRGTILVAEAVAGAMKGELGGTLPMGQGLVGWAATHHESVLAPDVARDSRYIAYEAATQSEMAAPLLLHSECLGVINVESHRARAYDATSLETLESLAARAATAIHNAQMHAAERQMRNLADTLRNVGLSLAEELNPDAILDTLLDHVAQVVPFDTASVMMIDDRGWVHIARHRGYERYGVADLVNAMHVPLENMHNLALMASEMTPQVVPNTLDDPRWLPMDVSAHIQSWAGAPIMARGRVLGLLSLDKTEPGFYTLEKAQHLAAFALQAGLALENAHLYAEQQRLAVTDSLTGLANRRYFDQELARELQRAGRFKRSTALLLMDLDDFKVFNDRYGHPAGDELLRSMALVLSQSVRAIDTAARYGGEEFVLILPESDPAAACATAQRLRGLVAQLPLLPVQQGGNGPALRVTISVGVAVAPLHGQSAAALVRAADEALYSAKRAGKNCVATFGGPTFAPQPAAARASS